MGRTPCREKLGMKKGSWTPGEDKKLLAYIEEHDHGSWRALPAKAGLQRCGKSCRLRWNNYLRPDIKRGKFSLQEEQTIIQLHALLGNRWSTITTLLPKRTDNEIKNYWNTHLKKKLAKMGIDPVTHKPKSNTLSNIAGNSKDVANLSHMAQWESARLEAEARLARESNQQVPSNINNVIPIQNQLISSSFTAYHQLNKAAATAPTTTIPPCLDVLKAWQAMWSKSTRDRGAVSGNLTGLGNDLESPTVGSSSNSTTAVNFVGSSSIASLHDMQYYFSGGVWKTEIENENVNNVVGLPNLIHNSCDHNSWDAAEENTNNGVGSCGGRGDFEDPKDYWSGILAFVNSRPTPDSPMF